MPAEAFSSTTGRRRAIGWLVLLAALAGLGWNVHYRAVGSDERRSDFIVFYRAAQALVAGENVYEVRHERGWRFFYPPSLPALLAPLARTPLGVAVLVWYALSAAALVWSAWRMIRLCDSLAGRPTGAWIVLLHLANLGPIVSGLQRGQISMLLFALSVEALIFYRQRRSIAAGTWIGVAAALKIYPALLALTMLLRRDWRGLAAMVGTVAVLWIVAPALVAGPAAGWRTSERFVSEVLAPFVLKADADEGDVLERVNYFGPTNQSMYAFAGRWLCRDAIRENDKFVGTLANLDPQSVRRVVAVASLLLLLVPAVLCLHGQDRGSWNEAALWSLLTAAPNFVSDVAWHHYYTSMTLLYVVALVGATWGYGRTRGRGLVILLTLALVGNWAHFASYTVRQMGVLMLTSLALWVGLAAVVWRRPRRHSGA